MNYFRKWPKSLGIGECLGNKIPGALLGVPNTFSLVVVHQRRHSVPSCWRDILAAYAGGKANGGK